MIENTISFLLVAGNSYIEISTLDERLARARPAAPRPHAGGGGIPRLGRSLQIFPSAERSRTSAAENVLHFKFFNPLDDHYGLLAAGARSACARHPQPRPLPGTRRCSTIRRGLPARWCSATAIFSPDQFERLKAELEQNYSGRRREQRPAHGAGRRPRLEKRWASRLKDMDFINATRMARPARLLWRQTVIPLLRRVTDGLAAQVGARFEEEGLRLEAGIRLWREEAVALASPAAAMAATVWW